MALAAACGSGGSTADPTTQVDAGEAALVADRAADDALPSPVVPAPAPPTAAPPDEIVPPPPAAPPVVSIPVPVPATETRIALQIVRFDGATDPTVVSSGIPLKPGLLAANAADRVRLRVGAAEQRIHASALGGTHPDGSARAVLVQFQSPAGAGPFDAILEIGTARETAMTAPASLSMRG